MNRIAPLVVVASVAPAVASIHNVSRINNYSLSFDTDTFENAMIHLSIRQDRTADAPGDSREEGWSMLANAFNLSWEAFDGVTLSNLFQDGNQIWGTITSPQGHPGYTIVRADAPPNTESFVVGVTDGRAYVKVRFISGGGVEPGNPSVWQMVIPGDWSQSGTGFHQHELVSYNWLWTLVRDFEYDPATDTTIFEIATEAYIEPPEPLFYLYGAPDCAGDFNNDGLLNVLDFLAFQTAFGNEVPAADFTGDGRFDLRDFLAFQTAFGNGC